MVKKAVILAAGEGQRLRPFTITKPKVMLPIANKPILQYVVEALVKNGIRHILMVVGYHREQVLDYFGSGEHFRAKIDYFTQPQQLGTAHALRQVEGKLEEPFLVLPGDNLIEAETLTPFLLSPAPSLLVKRASNASKYGVARTEGDRVVELREKPQENLTNLINTGIYYLTPEIFPLAQEELKLTSCLQRMMAQGQAIYAMETEGIWLDAVYPWDLLKLNELALEKLEPSIAGTVEQGVVLRGPVKIGDGSIIRSHSYIQGPVIIGQGCQLGPGSCLFPSTSLGDNVVIHPFTQVKNSIIGSNVEIGPNSLIQDSIIDQGCRLGAHFVTQRGEAEMRIEEEFHRVRLGALIGEGCEIGDKAIIAPGVSLGNGCQIHHLKAVYQNLPPGSRVF